MSVPEPSEFASYASNSALLATSVAFAFVPYIWPRTAHAEDATTPLLEVRVEGDRLRPKPPPKERSVAGNVIQRERLRGAGLQAADVLRSQPGVQIAETGAFGAPATLAIRGATAADTPVYLAGIRLNDDVGGAADLSLIPLWLIERVEIYRGHAPLEADRLGPGGAVFFEPRRPKADTLGLGATVGSFGAKRGFAYAGGRLGRTRALLGLSAESAHNRYLFTDDRGTQFDSADDRSATRQNADTTFFDAWALTSTEVHSASIDVVLNAARREQGVARLAVLPSRAARLESERLLTALSARVPFGTANEHLLEARTAAILTRSTYDDPLAELSLFTDRLQVSAERVEEMLAANLALSPKVTVRPMLSVSHERLHRSPETVLRLSDSQRVFARAAGSLEFRPSDALVVRSLLAVERHETRASGYATREVSPVSGRVGLELGSGRIRGFATFGRYVRVPTLGELYGVSGVVHGNPGLEPETGLTAELGVRAQSAPLSFVDGAYLDLFVFGRGAEGLIAYKRIAQGYAAPYNVETARVLGVELLSGAKFLNFLLAELSATLLDPRDTSPGLLTNDILPFRSQLVLAPRLQAQAALPKRVFVERASASVLYTYQSSRFVDPAGLAVIREQGTVDAECELMARGNQFAARARVANLLGAKRTDLVGYPLPGRAVFASLEATW